MQAFTCLESILLPLPVDNIDTDQIIPARFLKTISKEGLGDQLFYDWRYDAEGRPNPAFVLNEPRARQAQILLAGDNFGCGSSREHAPWALLQFGFRAVISTSFADIFRQNALKNALLPLVVSPEVHKKLFAFVEADPMVKVRIDLPSQTLALPDGSTVTFPIDPFAKECLLRGVDQLGYLLQHENEIRFFEARRRHSINTAALLR